MMFRPADPKGPLVIGPTGSGGLSLPGRQLPRGRRRVGTIFWDSKSSPGSQLEPPLPPGSSRVDGADGAVLGVLAVALCWPAAAVSSITYICRTFTYTNGTQKKRTAALGT